MRNPVLASAALRFDALSLQGGVHRPLLISLLQLWHARCCNSVLAQSHSTPPPPCVQTHVQFFVQVEGGAGYGAPAGGTEGGGVGEGYDFGVDPNLDPELALALRVSMEEERARQSAAAAAATEDAGGAGAPVCGT